MKPARPAAGGRGDRARLRLVGDAKASAAALLEQARDAEQWLRSDLARDLYERALHRASESSDVVIVHAALLASARLANAAGDPAVALDILDAALASATAHASDADCARAASLRSAVLWETGDIPGAEREAVRAREWVAGHEALGAEWSGVDLGAALAGGHGVPGDERALVPAGEGGGEPAFARGFEDRQAEVGPVFERE